MSHLSHHPTDPLEKNIKDCRQHFFPLHLPANTIARHVSREERIALYQRLFREVFPFEMAEENALDKGMKARDDHLKPLYDRYLKLHSENILFFNEENEPIGWSFGETEDHITFYMRNTGLIESYRNKGIYTAFLKVFLEYLKQVGYEKVTSHHLGTNRAVLIPKLKIGFDICGMELHETFGPNLKMVYFFHRDRKRVYYRKYGDKPIS